MKRFPLLFSPIAPVTPKSAPVIFYEEFRLKPLWNRLLLMIHRYFGPSFAILPCILPCYPGKLGDEFGSDCILSHAVRSLLAMAGLRKYAA
jgi:hypothetical protein